MCRVRPVRHRPFVQEFLELINRIDTKDLTPADIQALRHMLEAHPDLWRLAGDLSRAAAQRRYIRACDAQARIRTLALTTPALQVNIAAAGGHPATSHWQTRTQVPAQALT